jgi:YfiH family protein
MVGGSSHRMARVRQVHGRSVRVLKRGDATAEALLERPEADAIVSNEPGLALVVLVADCVPMVIADPQTGAAGCVHAGWRGTSAGVATATIDALRREFGSAPETLIAAIGPSIGPCCYEVGDELVDAFRRDGHAPADVARWFSRVRGSGRGGSLRLDVALANRDQLIAAGMRPDRVFACGLCTRTHRDIFDSYRADGDRAGRMAGVVRVPSAEC